MKMFVQAGFGRCFTAYGLVMLAFCGLRAQAADGLVPVEVGNQRCADVHPLNVPYVKSQLARTAAVQAELDVLRERQGAFPKRLAQLNAQVRRIADRLGAGNDGLLQELTAEAGRLAALASTQDSALAALSPARFAAHAEFVAMDRMTDERQQARLRIQDTERRILARVRELAAQDPEGARLAQEAWAADLELAMVNKARSNVQVQRDNVKRAVGGAIGVFMPQKAPEDYRTGLAVPVPPPADAAARLERFRQRNTPAEVQVLGERFFAQLDLATPGLEPVAALVRGQDMQAALDAYKRWFFRADVSGTADAGPAVEGDDDTGAEDGETSADNSGEALLKGAPPAAVRPPHPKAIEYALAGEVAERLPVERGKSGLLVARMGAPGAVNWVFPDRAPGDTPEMLRESFVELAQRQSVGGHLGGVLLDSYIISGNTEHLLRWTEYTDDWAMNWSRDIDASTMVRNYNMLIGYTHNGIIGRLRTAARLNTAFVDDLPATTLARLLLAANAEYLAPAIRLMRSGQYNFRIMMLTGMIPHTLRMQEFHSIRWAAREATRLAELSLVHNVRRDGANATLANAGHENTDGSLISLVDVLEKAKPEWLSPWWSAEFTQNLATFTRYWMHLMKQDGRAYRISTSPLEGHYGPGGSIKVNLLRDEPEVQARLWKVYKQSLPYDDPAVKARLWTAHLKGEPTLEPQVRSEGMAFSGYNFLRTGWERSDYFLYFHFLNLPVASGRDDNNGFMLLGNDQAYLLAPPVFVDNRIQYIGHDLPPWSGGKGMFSVSARPDAVKAMRFHSSATFDLAEGLYEGPYVLSPEHRKSAFCDMFGNYGMDLETKRMRTRAERAGETLDETPIRDVRHGRQVLSLQGRDLYIVTDCIDTPSTRRIEQKYTLPVPVVNRDVEARLALRKQEQFEAVRIDRERRSVRVRNPGVGGMDMFHFGNVPVTYGLTAAVAANIKKQPPDAPVPYSRQMSLSWTSEGPSTLVTVVAPHRVLYEQEPEPVFQRVEPLPGGSGLAGFAGVLADGTPVYYAASQQPARLGTGGFSVQARVLLRVGNRGIALDCTDADVNGRTMRMPHPDFEFVLDGNDLRIEKPIYRPIKPVTIEPAETVFAAPTAVTLACATPGVEIRYTLDGSDPRHDSPLYADPFTIRDTTWIKARAFRPGLGYTPWVQDGTHATVVSWAILEKMDLQPPVNAPAGAPGLAYAYVEALWPYLLAEGMTMPARKQGIVPTVLDVSPREGTVPFGMRYEGYIEVPEDGVYTFHAPPEFIFNDNESGYDLRVFVNGREWYPNTRWHAHGNWSVALGKGKHAFKVFYADMRRTPHRTEMQWGFPKEGFVWKGVAPELMISGPGLPKQVIPAAMLSTGRR